MTIPHALLSKLPRLNRANGYLGAVPCKVCGSLAPFFDVVDFNKCAGFYIFGPSGISVPYHRCDGCGFLFTTFFDDWSPDDFRRFIYNDDYVLVDPDYISLRPRESANRIAVLLDGFQHVRILDYGAGRGVFAERMRELGFENVESYDPFSLPSKPNGRFDIITCIEVIEHVPSPVHAITDMRALLAEEGCIFLGESLQPPDIDSIRANWWYVAPRNGHVSTFADRTLVTLAEKAGLTFHRGAGHPHILRTSAVNKLAGLVGRLESPLSSFRLCAPSKTDSRDWHGIEGSGALRFRWTATDRVTWEIEVPLGLRTVQVMVPFAHESSDRFAAQSTLFLEGRPAQTKVREKCVFAEFSAVTSGPMGVMLQTPSLKESRDKRRLGLAVMVDQKHGPTSA